VVVRACAGPNLLVFLSLGIYWSEGTAAMLQNVNPVRHAVRAHGRFLRLRDGLIHGIFYDRYAASQAA
jgi:hypothetical protein